MNPNSVDTTTRPWETIAIDIMSPYPATRSKNRFLFVTMNVFTRRTEGCLTDTRARYGYPKAIFSDNGPQFISRAFIKNMGSPTLDHAALRETPQNGATRN